jgi:choline dehydrogenase-like flavoprotein
MRCAEKLLLRGVRKQNQSGRAMSLIGLRKAMPTEQRPGGRPVCHYCGHCMKGCEIDSKYTSANTPIPLALKTGNLTLMTETTAVQIVTDKAGHTVQSVRYRNAKGEGEVRCKALIVAASTVETARLLLVSKLGLASGQLGRNLNSHFGITVIGLFPELRNRDTSQDAGTDYFHSLLTGMYWEKPSRDFEGTYQVQVASGIGPLALPIRNIPGVGASWKKQLKEMNSMHVLMNMQGMMQMSPRTFVELDPDKKDRFGIPLPRIHMHWTDNDLAMARDVKETCETLIKSSGGEIHSTMEVSPKTLVLDYNHCAGTARMGKDPRSSVVNTDCRVHETSNLYIGDASVFPAYPEKNPTLSNIAMAWRTSERLAERFRRREI